MDVITPMSGWLLDRVVWLDEALPGFARQVLRASPERRQHLAAYLSVISVTDDGRGDAASFLASADHQSILRSAFGEVPAGFRRALGKSGASPWTQIYYRRLYNLLDTGDTCVVDAIQRSRTLDPERLSIIEALPDTLCDSRIANRLGSSIEATDLGLVADLLERRGINRYAFTEALCRSSLPVSATVQRWSLRIPFPSGPIAACEGYRPISDGLQTARLARKYLNCIRNYLPSLIAGDHAFGEFHWIGQDVLISFDKSQGYWIAQSVHTYSNRSVHREVAKAAYAFAASHGVPHRRVHERGDKALDALRRLSRP